MPGLLPTAPEQGAYAGPILEPVDHDPFGDALQGVSDWAASPDQTNDVKRASVLPLEFTRQPGDAQGANALTGVSLAVPGMIKSLIGDAANALQAPRAVLSGAMTPEQAASATTPLLVDAAGSGLAAKAEEGTLNAIPGWHGTPHEFEPVEQNPFGQFDDSKMGTGEGAQVRGWGHYLAGNPATAISYRDALSPVPDHVLVNGKPETTNGVIQNSDGSLQLDLSPRITALRAFLANGSADDAREVLQNDANHMETNAKLMLEEQKTAPGPAKAIMQYKIDDELNQAQHARDAADIIAQEGHTWAMPKPVGHLLHVEMHPEEHELLDLDRTVAEQHPDVQKKLWALPGPIGDVFTHDMSSTGEDIQDSIWDHFHRGLSGGGWSDAGDNALHNQVHELTKDLPPELPDWDRAKAATSRLLDQAGIPGNRFLDQGSRNATPDWQYKGKPLPPTKNYLPDGKPTTVFDLTPEDHAVQTIKKLIYNGPSDNFYEGPEGHKLLMEEADTVLENQAMADREQRDPSHWSYDPNIEPTEHLYEDARKWLAEHHNDFKFDMPPQTHNYVMFHPRHVTIRGRNGQMLEPVEHNPFEGLE